MTVEIWGKPRCNFCEKAKQLCESRNLKYVYKQLDVDFTREEILEKFPDAKTFPQIIVIGTKVGGYDKFVTYLNETGYNGTGYTLS
jgi:glutaredoxin 1